MTEPTDTSDEAVALHRKRLFSGICLALIPTGASFALMGAIIPQLKAEFILTNTQVGAVVGAAIWGMAISLLVLGPLLEGFGMKKATWAAFLGHLLGVTTMIAAYAFRGTPEIGFWVLMAGAVLFAAGNGMIEVAGNPLTAALFPEKKAHMLNIFHAFFPLAIMAGSFIAVYLGSLGSDTFMGNWTFYLAIIYIPIIVYGILVLPQKFPKTENAEAGISVKEMFRFTLTSPLMYGFLLVMAIAIGLELGINRWIPAIYEAVGIQGLLMLSWISFIMMMLRFFSGPILGRLSPPGLLAIAALFTCIGIYLFGTASTNTTGFLAATFFGIGVAFFFPTIVGLVSERLPKTGSLGIVLTAGIGLLSAGTLGNIGVGALGDRQLAHYLNEELRQPSITLLEQVSEQYAPMVEKTSETEDPLEEYGLTDGDAVRVVDLANAALADIAAADGEIQGTATPQAFRAVGGAIFGLDDRLDEEDDRLSEQATAALESGKPAEVAAFAGESIYHASYMAKTIMGPAEGFAGQRALAQLAWVPLIMVVFFGGMFLRDRARGGYKAVRLGGSADSVDKTESGESGVKVGQDKS